MLNSNLSWKNPLSAIILVSILVLGSVVVISIIRDRIVNYPGWSINVVGQGRVSYQPDIANINMGVKVDKAQKAEDALKQLNDKMNRVISEVKKVGIDQADINTQNYSLTPHYDVKDDISNLAGYDASQILVVKVKNIKEKSDMITKAVSAATKAGVNQINSVNFEYSKLNELKQEARLKAISDAQEKKQQIANSLGVKLGGVIGWWENIILPTEAQVTYKGDMGGMGGGADLGMSMPNIPSGSQELVMEVNVSYKIK